MMNLEIPNRYGGLVKVRTGAIIKNIKTGAVYRVERIEYKVITLFQKTKYPWSGRSRILSLDNTVFVLLRNWSLPRLVDRRLELESLPRGYGVLAFQDISKGFGRAEIAIIPFNWLISAYRFISLKLRFPSRYTLFTSKEQLEAFEIWQRKHGIYSD